MFILRSVSGMFPAVLVSLVVLSTMANCMPTSLISNDVLELAVRDASSHDVSFAVSKEFEYVLRIGVFG